MKGRMLLRLAPAFRADAKTTVPDATDTGAEYSVAFGFDATGIEPSVVK